MIFKALLASAFTMTLLAAGPNPALAQMKSGDAMSSGDAMMAAMKPMEPKKPMTAAEKTVMAKCAKMPAAAAKKNAKCAKMSAMHPAAQM